MTWDTLQQLIRILMQVAGSSLVTKGVLTSEMADILMGGVLSLAQVGWWFFWNSRKPTTPAA